MRQPSSKSAQGGVALIEAMVAIFIFSIGVLAVIGMQAVSIRTSSDAKYRADAAYLADQLIGRMWADQANIGQYVHGAANCATGGTVTANTNAVTWLNTVARSAACGRIRPISANTYTEQPTAPQEEQSQLIPMRSHG